MSGILGRFAPGERKSILKRNGGIPLSLNTTPSGERIHIGLFGRRNAGKSSVINAVTGQSLAIVSDVAGTTTDPVRKAMELLPLGPVMVIDTPGGAGRPAGQKGAAGAGQDRYCDPGVGLHPAAG